MVATWQTCTLNAQGQLVQIGGFTITAATGDAIEGTFTQIFTRFPDNTVFILDPMTITGGTGRFAGVTGSMEGSGTFDPAIAGGARASRNDDSTGREQAIAVTQGPFANPLVSCRAFAFLPLTSARRARDALPKSFGTLPAPGRPDR